ncbi:MAG: DNA translocase FtsK [Candidatus Daviesbacteria bacterium]|nr:DNA translocase FtsK [Candidatus Daviesbacteria bacterium]
MSRRRSMYSLPKLKLKPKTIITIGTVIAFIFAIISGVSLFTETAKLLFWREFLYGNLGWTSYFSPFIFLISGLVLQRFKWQYAQPNVLLGLITIIISLSALTASFFSDGAGDLGNLIWNELAGILTGFGAAGVLLGILIVGLIVFFNTSASQVLEIVTAIYKFIQGNIFSPIFGRFFGPSLAEPRKISIKVSGMQETPKVAVAPQKETAIMADELVQNVAGQTKIWKYPPISLLSDKVGAPADRGDVKKNASTIEKTLDAFGVLAEVAEVNGGPSVTQYALKISSGTKIAKITNLQHDLAMALAARTGTVRVEAPIPGKSLVGIEVPNKTLEVVGLKTILASDDMQKQKSKLAIALGRDTSSKEIIVDLAKMPHCLVAGTTGSGKSIMLNALIASLLYRNSPEELKLILVDPKRVEMSNYNGIPHLLTPVINEPEKILSALKWTMAEMDRRYKTFQAVGVRNIQGYNEMSGFQALPYIVVVIDELADLMLFAPVEVEDAITRLAQLSRATGIHLVIATQRPSVDVITGLIKANIPCRVAFTVSSMVDSRVILDSPGAEKLLGRGDMLFLPPDASKPMRIQGVFVSDAELNSLIDFLKSTGVAPQYTTEITEMPIGRVGGKSGGSSGGADDRDELFDEAIKTVCQYDRASASLLQRRLRVGYARAARMIDELEAAGIVGAGEGSKPRDVLVRNADEYFAQKNNPTES